MVPVEQFFTTCGWTMVALGLITCCLSGCFKRGVITMWMGDICLIISILYPRFFAQFAFFSWSSINYEISGGLMGVILGFVVLFTCLLKKFSKYHQEQNVGGSSCISENDYAPASLFSEVNEKAKVETKKTDILFKGLSREKDRLC